MLWGDDDDDDGVGVEVVSRWGVGRQSEGTNWYTNGINKVSTASFSCCGFVQTATKDLSASSLVPFLAFEVLQDIQKDLFFIYLVFIILLLIFETNGFDEEWNALGVQSNLAEILFFFRYPQQSYFVFGAVLGLVFVDLHEG
ncbi:hypothetical protein Tco_1502587 [Tanacetum coccineum]